MNNSLCDADILILNILTLEESPVSLSRLSSATGIDGRSIRGSIQRLRLHEYPVCNDKDGRGYYIAKTPQQIEQTIRDYTSRCAKMGRAVRGLKRAQERLTRGSSLFAQMADVAVPTKSISRALEQIQSL